MGVIQNKGCGLIEIYGMTSVLYISFFLKKKGWQDGAHMRSQMCNPKDFSQDKIEDVICVWGGGCRVYDAFYRRDTRDMVIYLQVGKSILVQFFTDTPFVDDDVLYIFSLK